MRITRTGVAAGLAILAVVLAGLLLSPSVVLSRLRGLIFSPWFPLVLVGLYLVRPVFAWPITLLSALVGYRFGIAVGLPLALLGAVATSLVPYVLGRLYGIDAGGLVGRLAARSGDFFDAVGGFRGVAAARLAPTPAEAISVAAGAGDVRLRAFVAGTLVGELPWTIAAVWLGASLGELAVDGVAIDPRLVVGGLVAAGVLLAGPAYRWATDRWTSESGTGA